MYYKLPRAISIIFVITFLSNVSISGLSHADQHNIGTAKNMEEKHIICLQTLAETTIVPRKYSSE